MEITEWTPTAAIGVRHLGMVTGTGRFTLSPIELGSETRFGWEESLVFPWCWAVRSALSLAAPGATPIWNRNLST